MNLHNKFKLNTPTLFRMLVATTILVLIANYTIIKFQAREQIAYIKQILRHSESVSTQIHESLNRVVEANINNCNDSNINRLREILLDYQDVIDVGITHKGKVICTAGWGLFDKSRGYVKEEYSTSDGYIFDGSDNNFHNKKIHVDATIYKTAIAFTSPFAFKKIKEMYPQFDVVISTHKGRHDFLILPGTHHGGAGFAVNNAVHAKICSKTFDLCVLTRNGMVGFLSLDPLHQALVVLICLLLGVFLSWFAYFYLNSRKSFEYRLKKAVQDEQLYLEYQPVVRMNDEKIVGVETLIRWQDKLYGKVSPELFIDVAEKIGVYGQISEFVIKRLTEELSHYLTRNSSFTVSINIGGYEIEHCNYINYLYEQCIQYRIKPSQIKIEITERSTLPHDVIADFSRRARAKGFCVSIDDFGTGTANLIWLTEIDFDEIKIDKFYVKGLQEEYKRNILTCISGLVIGIGAQIVFEGVEDIVELNYLKGHNENAYAQGWFFYKSMNIDELCQKLNAASHD
ncbi:EAL domain-containing protein [Franconibacter daqui]|uniref:cyclic-guanylate-specific phosphodiesterase n=1 Tax=Franconibacter daqui TaxID=2047724 RepID=A0ABV1PMW6_9ENTR